MVPVPLFTLRGHLSNVVNVEVCYLKGPSDLILVTGDEAGWIIWWNLGTKRPLAVWKGHDSIIVTLKIIEENLLLSHSRDSEIKIWKMEDNFPYAKTLPDVELKGVSLFLTEKNAAKGKTKNEILLKKYPLPEHVSIPVNSLSFCNVDYKDGYLITPATLNSNNFDLYFASFRSTKCDESLNDRFNLKRLANDVDPWKLYKKSEKYETSRPVNILKRDTFGAMMKVMFVQRNMVFVGYESGDVISIEIEFNFPIEKLNQHLPETLQKFASENKVSYNKTLINKDVTFKLLSLDSSNVPNPILSLEFDSYANSVISGSAGKKVTFHKLPLSHDVYHCNLRHAGSLSISANKDTFVVAFWDGVVKGCLRNGQEKFKIAERLPRIGELETNSGQAEEKGKSNYMKIGTVKLVDFSYEKNLNTKYKYLIKQKRDIKNNDLLVCGYENGIVKIFKLMDDCL